MQITPSNAGPLLLYGRDPILLDTRRRVLQIAGFTTDMAEALPEIQAKLDSKTAYGLLIVCHTAPEQDRRTLRALAEEAAIPVFQIDALITPTALIATAAAMR
ncbi:hypothetical protein HDF16_005184 [Granulicella aggregans]|uniref:Uncharacterized protein n=1 Tax=Granulicella aggregans TaxID=474949 RepID=A0A7W7ZIN4_9BACT|nr:hypothetical protein [Granulicella aggregans]MBB5060448.1 hypothetical protein [Granulicella aggregans]